MTPGFHADLPPERKADRPVTEIELKARVADPAAVENRLRQFCAFAGETDKNDRYWQNSAGLRARIREETGRPAVLTWKQKTLAGGIEVNEENEFSVSSAAQAAAFLSAAGFTPVLCKKKHTKTFRFSLDGGQAASLELSDVYGLGFFLEIEICLQQPDTRQTEAAKRILRELLAKAGLPEQAVEPRYYSELLALKSESARKSSVEK